MKRGNLESGCSWILQVKSPERCSFQVDVASTIMMLA